VQNEDLRATQAALETSRNNYAELYDSAPVGYFTFNDNGIVLHVNLTGAAQLGMERSGLVGTPFTIYAATADRRAFYKHLHQVFKSRSGHRSEIKMNRSVKEGKHRTVVPFYAELESVYSETPQGGRECRTILTDITRRKEAEEIVRKMNEGTQQKNSQLEETGRARHRFFSFISHELKTPLNSILGFAQLLIHGSYGPLTPEQKKAMVRLKMSGGEMVHLINNLLDAAKIEMEKSAVQRTEIHVVDLLEEVSLSFEPLLIEKKLLFEMQIDPATPKTFYTDREKVRSIVTNLLSNAVRFTRQGSIRMTVAPLSGGGGIRLAVSDTGIGIEPEHLERIFEEYEQSGFVRENPIRYASGTGLGLSIVKHMVLLLGGTVDVQSTVGKGSTFTVVLFDYSSDKRKAR
jgi:PAS domain S-box-containing protein